MILLIDDETQTYWDHITGEAVHGPLLGEKLQVFGVTHTTVGAALSRDPELRLRQSSKMSLFARGFSLLHKKKIGKAGFIPPPFRATMAPVDPRLPENTQGVGVVVDSRSVFFPMAALGSPVDFAWGARTLRVGLDPLDGVPGASWADESRANESRPMQLFTRWFGFSLTYPECEVFGERGGR